MQLAITKRLESAFDDALGDIETGRIGVAVSGGSDSLALLFAFADWAKPRGLDVFAATVDHGLRKESANEAEKVARLCADNGISHDILIWETGWSGQGNLQDAARTERYKLLASWAADRKLDCVLLGHTEDDLAETFLLRLRRGAGVDGLSAMREWWSVDGQRFCRPFLGLRRQELRDYLAGLGREWIEDPSNENTDFERIKMRKALPEMEDAGLTVEVLAHSARNLASARKALSYFARSAFDNLATSRLGVIKFERDGFTELPDETQRRLLSAACRCVSTSRYSPRGESVGRALVALAEGKAFNLQGCLILPRKNAIEIGREASAVESARCSASVIWDNVWTVTGEIPKGSFIAALGESGLSQIDGWRNENLSGQHARSLPGLWVDNRLISSPLDENGKDFKWKTKCDENRCRTILLSH